MHAGTMDYDRDVVSVDLLIIGTSVDVHIDAVVKFFPQNVRWVRLDVDKYPVETEISVAYQPSSNHPRILCRTTLGCFDISNVQVVWFRRLGAPQVAHGIMNPAHRTFALGEAEAMISALAYLLSDAYWISPYEAVMRARSKVYQLSLAIRCGLTVPRTLVTNSPDEAISFIRSSEKTIYKTVNAPSIMEKDRYSLIFSHLIEESDLSAIDEVKFTPCQFQSYIEKAHELRITFTGREFFTAVIHSQESSHGVVDWRAALRAELRYSTTVLPKEIEDKLRCFLEMLGLSYGAIDMIVTPEGEFIFLEVNPHGAWLWIENEIGTPIAASLAESLCSNLTVG